MAAIIVLAIVAFLLFVLALTSIKIVRPYQRGVVERLGRYKGTVDPGLRIIVPFVDRVRPLIDLREQVVSFPPQPVITEDNLTALRDLALMRVANQVDEDLLRRWSKSRASGIPASSSTIIRKA